MLEVGVCGTDREIAHGLFGVPPEGSSTSRARPRGARRHDARRRRLLRAAISSPRPCGAPAGTACLRRRLARRVLDRRLQRARHHPPGRVRARGGRRVGRRADPGAAGARPARRARRTDIGLRASAASRPRDRRQAAVAAATRARDRRWSDRDADDAPAPARRRRGVDCVPRAGQCGGRGVRRELRVDARHAAFGARQLRPGRRGGRRCAADGRQPRAPPPRRRRVPDRHRRPRADG